ncbi:DNA glycosylase AlkZ-like family protein [Antrihabitans cavernicola]|uniref:Winged helix DNA-binding domain-containing protein n=1 Tax=Antrihabitans cavernicola TaxID=2495913 RepID=A0A5A7S523_9NOCA|nr:crosslink repair DNA glycosylase YcaQ family protein [Spelaeibacter cavernicola]KAA0020187.1 winged helix DNA-binding domain-containing protein [Spelaeibacter cavernicola]
MDRTTLRAWWSHRQCLDGSITGSAAQVLSRTGWARSVAGATPYLGLFARAGIDRRSVDADVAALDIHELPSTRACTYVVPAEDFGLALSLATLRGGNVGMAVATKHLGVTEREIDALCDAILAALGDQTLDPTAIKSAVGDAVRNLGADGKKRGQSTTLSLGLGRLQNQGLIRRVPVNGRLDQQRYGYVRWTEPPTMIDADSARISLARKYFDWAAPASLAHFRWFSAFTAAAAKKAIGELDLLDRDGLLIPRHLIAEFDDFACPATPQYALVGGIDGIHLLHRDMETLLDPADAARPVPGGKQGSTLGTEADPPAHLIVDRGRIVGLWEFDTDAGEIVASVFVDRDDALDDVIASTESFVRDQLGDARSFSLDSPKSRAPRIAALRG